MRFPKEGQVSMFDYTKPKDDVSKVKDLELFDALIRGELELFARQKEIRQAQANGAGSDYRSKEYYALRREIEKFNIYLRAMQHGGRDMYAIHAEILRCFKKGKSHKAETITRRFFGIPSGEHVPYSLKKWIEQRLAYMGKKEMVDTDYTGRTYETLYFVITPEMREVRRKERERREARKKARKEMKNRQAVVMGALTVLGCDSHEADSKTGTITLNMADIESLIALASKAGAA